MAANSILPADVERYKQLRSLSMGLNRRMVRTVPRKAMEEIGKALGIFRRGTLVFDSMDMTAVLMDCCLYDWIEGGENLVRKFAESNAPRDGTDESLLLRAFQSARYRIVLPTRWLPGAGVHVEDVISREEFFLMDVNLSQCEPATVLLATRTIPLDGYWMTGGAALPMPKKSLRLAMDRLQRAGVFVGERIVDEHRFALTVVRACLESGVAEQVRFEDPGESTDPEVSQPFRDVHRHRRPQPPGRNSSCPCGSGKRFKRCCGPKGVYQDLAANSQPRPSV